MIRTFALCAATMLSLSPGLFDSASAQGYYERPRRAYEKPTYRPKYKPTYRPSYETKKQPAYGGCSFEYKQVDDGRGYSNERRVLVCP